MILKYLTWISECPTYRLVECLFGMKRVLDRNGGHTESYMCKKQN